MKIRPALLLLSAALAALLSAPAAAQPVLIAGATVHVGDGTTLPKAWVLVDKAGAIAQVSPTALPAPAGAKVIEAEGLVLTPGLIDLHSQLGLVDVWAVPETVDVAPEGVVMHPAVRVADAFNPRNLVIPITRKGGVTTILATPAGGLIPGQAALVHLGDRPGAWATVAEPAAALVIHFDEQSSNVAAGSRAERLYRLRNAFDDARFLLKNPKAYDDNRSRPLALPRLDLLALNDYLTGKKPTLLVAHRAADIEAALDFAAEQKLRPLIVGGAEAWLVAERLAAARVPVLLDAFANLPASFEQLGAREDNAALLHKAGVPVILSAFEAHNTRNLRYAAGNAARTGLPRPIALRAITLAPAAALGLDATLGTIAPGKRANLALWTGDPLEASSWLHTLLIDGKNVSLDSRQDELYRRYSTLPRRSPPPP